MSLEEKTKKVLSDFDNASSKEILEILQEIQPQFQNQLTSEYLQGKLQKILDTKEEPDKKAQCKALTPYLDWYLQGL